MGKLLVIAGNSGPFSDFGPYAASINGHGAVAFFATRRSGATGVFCGDGGPIRALPQKAAYRSHPALNDLDQVGVYADLAQGSQAVLVGTLGDPPAVVAHEAIPGIGPLGPTINAAGSVAFRATSAAGRAGIYVATAGALTRVAEAGETFAGFDGLPVLLDDGSVFFRADFIDGSAGIHVWRSGATACACVVRADGGIRELGRFPHANSHGVLAFTATHEDGSPGIFTLEPGGTPQPVLASARDFENIRVALIDERGRIVFCATPASGDLAVYALEGPGTPHRRVIGLRDAFGTCPLTDFALNPVSFNNAGQIALRLKLADGRQFIARLDVFA